MMCMQLALLIEKVKRVCVIFWNGEVLNSPALFFYVSPLQCLMGVMELVKQAAAQGQQELQQHITAQASADAQVPQWKRDAEYHTKVCGGCLCRNLCIVSVGFSLFVGFLIDSKFEMLCSMFLAWCCELVFLADI